MKIPYDKLDIILETSKELIKEKERQRKINERMLFLIDISSFATGICIFVFSVAKELFIKGEKRINRAHYLRTDIRRLIKNYPIYLGIVGVAVSMWFSLEDYAFNEGMVNGNALDTYCHAANYSSHLLQFHCRLNSVLISYPLP